MRSRGAIAGGLTVVVVAVMSIAVAVTASAAPGDTSRVSVASDGTEAKADSILASISKDGRFIAFQTDASNLVPGDTNGTYDIFVHDTETGETRRVSVARDGAEGNQGSFVPWISADGTHVAFASSATNLVPDDTNDVLDIFVHDIATGETVRVSVASDGTEAGFHSNGASISGDGRYVAFFSGASNLVPDDTSSTWDVFVHDLATSETLRASVASSGDEANGDSAWPAISIDGGHVVFQSAASNLVPDDTNGVPDVFVRDIASGETTRASVSSDGTQADAISSSGTISEEGRFIAFNTSASNLSPDDYEDVADVFVHDRETGETTLVTTHAYHDGSGGITSSFGSNISADGRYVTFSSLSRHHVPDDRNGAHDVFVFDRHSGETRLVSLDSNGNQGDGGASGAPSQSAFGRHIAFLSEAVNLVPGDTNGYRDVFVREFRPVNHFVDDNGHLFEDDINAIAEAGITRGCNPPENDRYCPDESFLRGQAAAFLRRALDVPASDADHFTDDDDSVFEGDINAIATEGITLGCNPPDNTLFCPDDAFTRGQAAAFVRRALNVPATDTDYFTDDSDSVFEGDINAIAEAGVTRGCNPPDNDRYCPDELLTRGQAAVFMRRALLP